MKSVFAFAFSLFLTVAASAQNYVYQSGGVTPNHAVRWITNGVIGDGGTAANGFLSSIGVLAQGPAICQQSAAPPSPYNQLCLGVNTAGAATISLQNYGGAAAQNLNFVINGVTYPFPQSLNSLVIGGTAIINCSTNGNGLYNNNGILGCEPITASPGGSNTDLQYNSSGSFGGISGATSDGTNLTVGATNLRVLGSSTGYNTLETANAGASNYVTTFPAATDTVVELAQTQTLTNKTIASSTDVLGGVTLTLGSDATGDIYYRNSGGVLTRLGIGSTGNVLTVSGGLPAWESNTGNFVTTFSAGTTGFTPNSPTTGAVTLAGTLVVANGGTNCSIASITCFNNITGFTAAGTTGTTSSNLVFSNSPTLVAPVLGAATGTSLTLFGGNALAVNGTSALQTTTITSASANALAVGLNGATNPAFNVDASTASQVSGLNVKGGAHNGTVAIVVTDSSGAANLTINALSTGTIGIGSVSTGAVTITPATTFGAGVTAASLATPSSNIGGALCATSAGVLLYNSGANCYAGGGTAGGSNTQVQYNALGSLGGITGVTSNGTAMTFANGDLILTNATSGSVTVVPVTGALGTVTASLPANSGTVAELNYAQTWSAAQTFNTSDLVINGGTATAGLASVTSGGVVSSVATSVVVQVFTSTGTYTPTSGMSHAIIECLGGGGGGGGTVSSGASEQFYGGSGGAGSRSLKYTTAAAVGASQTVTIGAAGTAGVSGNNAGGNGGDTSVGSLCVGKGGSGGAPNNTNYPAGGAGGVAGTGDVTGTGASGGAGSATSGTPGVAANGADSPWGGGGAGNNSTSSVAGNAGTGYGSGGSAGYSYNAGGAEAGGAGTKGLVIITEYINL